MVVCVVFDENAPTIELSLALTRSQLEDFGKIDSGFLSVFSGGWRERSDGGNFDRRNQYLIGC